MRVYIPFDPRDPKTRLSPVLDDDERVELSFAMLEDVYEAVEATSHSPVVLSTQPLEREPVRGFDTEVCSKPLTPAVNAVLEREERPVAVVMSDLALATPEALERLFVPDAELVVVPGRGGGTNAFVAREEGFRVDYHGASFLDHLETARKEGVEVETVDSFRLSTDIDEPEDIVEVLIRGEGASEEYLRGRFEVVSDSEENRVTVRRL